MTGGRALRSARVDADLARLRGAMKPAGRSVRRLAEFANVHKCPTAAVAFAARVDTDRVLRGTKWQMPFGQSPFALGRGVAFEKLLRKDKHAELRRALTEGLGADFSKADIRNLHEGYPPNNDGLTRRASDTQDYLRDMTDDLGDLLVIDGAVLRGTIGGFSSFFEADEMAIGFDGTVVIGENKSWPIVDGRPTDPDALGGALDQAATYVLLARQALEAAGGDPALVSDEVVIITPRNTGLSPVLHRQDAQSRVRRVERLLAAVPDVADVADSVPASATFSAVADAEKTEDERLEAFIATSDAIGRKYEPGSCLTSCGFAWACRSCSFSKADPGLIGEGVTRVLPGIERLDRVSELAKGATPAAEEEAAAAPLARAERLLGEVKLPTPKVRKRPA